MAVTCIACDPPEHTMTHEAYWYVKNHTGETLSVTAPSRIYDYYAVVNPGDSDYFYAFNPPQHLGAPSFDLLMWITPEEERYVDIRSHGVLLKRWNYSDKAVAGKQLFNESCWRLYTEHFEPGVTQVIYKWVFDIYPEDLFGDDALPEQEL